MKPEPPAYTRDEMVLLCNSAEPTRGPVCPRCGSCIPQFADLTPPGEARVRKLIRQGQKLLATQELRNLTHCPLSWAKIWVAHAGRPDAMETTAPCPYCGKALKTALAKQCPHCNMDWHDAKNPKRLGTAG